MRIRKRPRSHLLSPDYSFRPSPLLGGASATAETIPDRGARENAEESVVAAADNALEREIGSRRAGFQHSNADGLLSPPDSKCTSDLSSHPPPAESLIDGRNISSNSLFAYSEEAAKREPNEDTTPVRLSAEFSSQPKTKRGCSRHLRERRTPKEEEQENPEEADEDYPEKAKKAPAVKKRRRPAVLMEGSRCSRVNGRGWRCSQQTLVGYSLCEHHLGKSRLRSVNSVKCNDGVKKEELLTSEEDSEAEEKKKTVAGKMKKKRKIGQVKARSISSLMSQTQVSLMSPPPQTSPVPGAVGICMQ